MSIVEKALKKLQSNSDTETQSPGVQRAVGARIRLSTDATEHTLGTEAEISSGTVRKHIVVDKAALREAGVLCRSEHEKRLAGEYRQIKRPLIAKAIGRGMPAVPKGAVIAVASALPGEGKSFTSVNLALSLAQEQDLSVLLIDADIAKRHLSHAFGVAEEPGFLDAVSGETADLDSLILDTSIPRFSFLPSGQRAQEVAAELLGSNRMEQIFERAVAKDPRTIIVLDCPPLLVTGESRSVVAIAGQVVLVVHAGTTSQSAVLDGLSYIGTDKAVGIVLNQSINVAPTAYYGYGTYLEHERSRVGIQNAE